MYCSFQYDKGIQLVIKMLRFTEIAIPGSSHTSIYFCLGQIVCKQLRNHCLVSAVEHQLAPERIAAEISPDNFIPMPAKQVRRNAQSKV